MGGFVVFGVSNKGEIIGQQVSSKTLNDIAVELRRIEPPAFPDIEIVNLEKDKAVILVMVSGGRSIIKNSHTYLICFLPHD